MNLPKIFILFTFLLVSSCQCFNRTKVARSCKGKSMKEMVVSHKSKTVTVDIQINTDDALFTYLKDIQGNFFFSSETLSYSNHDVLELPANRDYLFYVTASSSYYPIRFLKQYIRVENDDINTTITIPNENIELTCKGMFDSIIKMRGEVEFSFDLTGEGGYSTTIDCRSKELTEIVQSKGTIHFSWFLPHVRPGVYRITGKEFGVFDFTLTSKDIASGAKDLDVKWKEPDD